MGKSGKGYAFGVEIRYRGGRGFGCASLPEFVSRRGWSMRRLGVILGLLVSLGAGVMTSGAAVAGQRVVDETAQVPPLTPPQIVFDCAISGAALSAITTMGWIKPMTVALGTMPMIALLHEAVYGCGIGVISGYVGRTVMDLLPSSPPPNPFAAESAALPATTVQR